LGEVFEYVALLLAQCSDRRQDAGYESAAGRALGAEGFSPPQDGTSQGTFCVVIGWLDTFYSHKSPERIPYFEDLDFCGETEGNPFSPRCRS
jgi:hypothetical protein